MIINTSTSLNPAISHVLPFWQPAMLCLNIHILMVFMILKTYYFITIIIKHNLDSYEDTYDSIFISISYLTAKITQVHFTDLEHINFQHGIYLDSRQCWYPCFQLWPFGLQKLCFFIFSVLPNTYSQRFLPLFRNRCT